MKSAFACTISRFPRSTHSPNGNDRRAKMLANVLCVKNGKPRFTWGRANLVNTGLAREAYFAALRAVDADSNNIRPLLEFARS
jgi:hypothetical protein